MKIPFPRHPIEAATHLDPYPYYADLSAHTPLYWDNTVRLWVASSAATVTAVLKNPLCQVRPPAEPVPAALLDSPAAVIFRHLVRMNDGALHYHVKGAVSSTLQTMNAESVLACSKSWAALLTEEMKVANDPGHLTAFAFRLPIYVVASLLGIHEMHLLQVSLWMSDFAYCLAPNSLPEQIERGKEAAIHLVNLLDTVAGAQAAEDSPAGLQVLGLNIGYPDREIAVANGIGLLSHAYEATAGLMSNTLLTLARHQEVYEQILTDPDLLPLVLQEVLRYDPPIQNTRRYLASPGTVAGVEMQEGDGVLIVLAAANRDPAVNHHPEQFDPKRSAPRLFTFGMGTHACPGEILATIIARAGVEQILQAGVNVPHLAENITYRPSGNTRIPLFGGEKQ